MIYGLDKHIFWVDNSIKIKVIKLFFAFCILHFAFSSALYAQGTTRTNRPPQIMPYAMGAQYYVYLGEDMGLQINVQIWGQILRPGMYSVPKTTDVIGLISFAGGPTEHSNLSKVKLIRSNPHPEVFNIDLQKYIKKGETKFIPVLKPGDTVIVPENEVRKFSKLVQMVAQIAIIVNVYNLLFGE